MLIKLGLPMSFFLVSFSLLFFSVLPSGQIIGVWGPSETTYLPGLLRSDQGGLSVSSPLGEQEDACGLRGWCKLLVLEFYWFST